MEAQVSTAEAAEVSVIGSGISVTGNIEASVDLHILGRVNGDVRCAILLLGADGEVKGNVYADAVRVAGAIEGSVEAADVAVEAAARIHGDVTYSRIRISNGGIVDGRLTHRPAEARAEPAHLKLVDEKARRPAQPQPHPQPQAQAAVQAAASKAVYIE